MGDSSLKRTPAIFVHHLRAQRHRKFSLSVDSLWLGQGQILCLAGANGSGKTTFLEALVGLAPYHGTVRILGRAVASDQHRRGLIGYVPDDDSWIIPELTAREYLDLLETIYERTDAGLRADMDKMRDSTAALLRFTQFDQPLGTLSHGNRKKVQLLAALIHEPPVLIIDELRNGLDPLAIRAAEQLLQRLARQGVAVLAATHDLWWAERFADTIVMLDEGCVLLDASTADITAEAGSVEQKFLTMYGAGRE
jgi:ABC-2 type transport system ATP-binding protein